MFEIILSKSYCSSTLLFNISMIIIECELGNFANFTLSSNLDTCFDKTNWHWLFAVK